MQYSLTLLFTALISFTFAQNPFLYNQGALTSLTAGTTFAISWAPSTGTQDTVTLLLRQGDPSSLVTVLTIASNITNTGSFLWTLPTTLVNGTLYTFEIYNDLNHDLANYSNQFTIISTNTVSSVIANPIATTTNSAGFVVTVYATASQTSSVSASKTGESPATGTGSAASATASKNSGVRVGKGMGGIGAGVLALMAVL